MLDDLIKHFQNTSNKSLLARIYGVYTIKSNYFDSLDVVVMQNTCRLLNQPSKNK